MSSKDGFPGLFHPIFFLRQEIIKDIEEKVHPILCFKKDGSFPASSAYMKHSDPNQGNPSSKIRICEDNAGRVFLLWARGPLAILGAEETLFSCAMAMAWQIEGAYFPGALSTYVSRYR